MPDDALITAPFIVPVRERGVDCLRRTDPGAPPAAVRDSAAVRALLARFRAGVRADGVVADAPAPERPRVREAVDALARAGLLLPVRGLSLSPPGLELEITNRCNARCVMCPRAELRPLGSMDEATFAAVLRLVRDAALPGVVLQGIGEPTLHRALVPWCARLREALPPDAPLAVVTNGFLATPELLECLGEAGVTLVQWSFHSLRPETYDAIMGVRRFADVRARLEACAARHAPLLAVNVVLMDANADEVEEIRAWLAGLGISPDRVGVIPCFSRGGWVDARALRGHPAAAPAGRCLFVRRSLFVAWNGDLLPCSNDIRGELARGNVRQQPPDQVLAAWRDERLVPPCDHRICQGCDHHTRGALETEWFERMRGRPVVPLRAAAGPAGAAG